MKFVPVYSRSYVPNLIWSNAGRRRRHTFGMCVCVYANSMWTNTSSNTSSYTSIRSVWFHIIYTNFICRPTISGLWENPMFWNLSTVFYQTEWHRDWFGERLKPMFRDLSRSKVRESEEGGENRKDKNRKCKGGTSSIVF